MNNTLPAKPALTVRPLVVPPMPCKPSHPLNLLSGSALRGQASPGQWSAVNAWRAAMGFAKV